jgi:hypothetical protein
MMFRLRLCSIGFLAVALLTALYKRKLQAWIEEAVWPLPRFLSEATDSMAGGWRADGKVIAWAVPVLFLVGAILRVRFLFGPVGFDEASNFVWFASKPLYLGVSWYPAPNNHVFYTLLMHFAWRLFGDHEWAIRLPALLAGLLLIPVTYWAGRVLYERHSALIAAALVTATSPLVFFSVNGRGYTLVCVFFLLLLIIGRYLLDHDSSPGWLLWGLVAAVGFYTIPIMMYAVGTAALWLFLSSQSMEPKGRRHFLAGLGMALAVAAVVTTLLYLPVLIVSGPKLLFDNPWVHPMNFADLWSFLPARIGRTWKMLTENVPSIVVWMLVAGFVISLFCHRRVATNRVSVPIAAALCIAPLLVAQRAAPQARMWLFLVPLFAIVSSAGLWFVVRLLANRAGTRCLSSISTVMAMGFSLLLGSAVIRADDVSSRDGVVPGIDDVVVWMKGQLMPRDIVLGKLPATVPLIYYFRRNGIRPMYHAAPCDAMSLVYSFNVPLSGDPATGETRVLAVVLDGYQPAGSMLPMLCVPVGAFSRPKLIYAARGASVYESYIRPGASPSISSEAMENNNGSLNSERENGNP